MFELAEQRVLRLGPEQQVDSFGGLAAEAVGDVLVAEEHGRLDPAEDVHDGAGLDSGLEHEGGGAVAGVKHPVVGDLGFR